MIKILPLTPEDNSMLIRLPFSIIFCAMLTLFLASTSYSTEIYISVDEQGNRVFSDVPSKESRKHKLKEISIVPAIKIPQKTMGQDQIENELDYQTLIITNPSQGENFTRDKLGNIHVSAQLVPNLQEGDEATLLVNGQEVQSGSHLSWQLSNTDRGEHTIQILVRDKETQSEKISSQTVTVYVRR
ncbi:MAG TPA: hypothetical protein DIC30_06835 [Oceanospirillales bacterium]|jgi:hypothetical protein|nr:hypothetical protein [Oleispira sp.]HCM05710.1 hypothetical protein [Oceanospirillales bacterium]|tara:strand:- start:2020 stop:2577 length:558 start_codon:yes stop_codon:yes gene_type:complete